MRYLPEPYGIGETTLVYEIPATIQETIESLQANHFDARFVQTISEAKSLMLDLIPLTSSVGVGDSTSLRQIGILEALGKRGNDVINPWLKQFAEGADGNLDQRALLLDMATRTMRADVFVASSNAVTADGKIVNIDRGGNRVAGMVFGPSKVILPIGRNKIVKNVDEALHRIKHVIAPIHARRKGQTTPCAVTGTCTDCFSPDRICNVTVIMEKQPLHTDISIIVVNEDLGLGWDPSWDAKRIDGILSNYYEQSWDSHHLEASE